MKLIDLLLGTAAGFAAVAGAQAADLPTKKAAPVEYVRVCSQFGAGFWYVPGSDTCIKLSGRIRADYFYNEPYTPPVEHDLDPRSCLYRPRQLYRDGLRPGSRHPAHLRHQGFRW